ncbi:hypothetical protein, partial [Pseudomonas syringae group genomosp. 3]|uniref:hypothetical protein n=1 Tax=Pseudomonas syringae group genomosp. 3 TaxID=251701 RepID=UPI00119D524D
TCPRKGCEAALKQATLILPDAPCVPVFLPVPGSSRTSEASLGPLPHNGLLPAGRGGLVREGLRSGPETGHLDFAGCTVRTCFSAGSRQFADKPAPTRAKRRLVRMI